MEPIQRANIRLAATVLLLRDTSDGLEVFMVQRPGGVDFPDLHVFPGGKVDDADFLEECCLDLDDAAASAQLSVEAGGIRYWVAAIRECFEECGVLLAQRQDAPFQFADEPERAKFQEYRRVLTEEGASFAQICRNEALQLNCGAVAYLSHWLTPDSVPRRFDTRFFVAALPHGQEPLAHDWETAGSDWVTPAAALAKSAAGEWQMIYPTLTTLKTMREFATVADALAAIRDRRHAIDPSPAQRREGMHPL